MSEGEVLQAVQAYGIRLVEITGGEPLMQRDTFPLATKMLDSGFSVLIETNGSLDIRALDKRAVVIMDIKTPKSGMFGQMALGNLDFLKEKDELKFVVADREDYDWVVRFIRDYHLPGKCTVLLSPAYGLLSAETLSRWIIEDRLPVRLNLQIHKYIYSPDRRGV